MKSLQAKIIQTARLLDMRTAEEWSRLVGTKPCVIPSFRIFGWLRVVFLSDWNLFQSFLFNSLCYFIHLCCFIPCVLWEEGMWLYWHISHRKKIRAFLLSSLLCDFSCQESYIFPLYVIKWNSWWYFDIKKHHWWEEKKSIWVFCQHYRRNRILLSEAWRH